MLIHDGHVDVNTTAACYIGLGLMSKSDRNLLLAWKNSLGVPLSSSMAFLSRFSSSLNGKCFHYIPMDCNEYSIRSHWPLLFRLDELNGRGPCSFDSMVGWSSIFSNRVPGDQVGCSHNKNSDRSNGFQWSITYLRHDVIAQRPRMLRNCVHASFHCAIAVVISDWASLGTVSFS